MPLHRLFIAILAMVMALSLAACNSDSDSGGSSGATATEATATPAPVVTAVSYSAADFAGTWSNFTATYNDVTHVGTITFDANGRVAYVSFPTVPEEAALGQLHVTSDGAVTGELAILLTFSPDELHDEHSRDVWYTDGAVSGGFRSKTHLHLNLGWRGTRELTK